EELMRSAAAMVESPADAGVETIMLETVSDEEVLEMYQPTVGGVRQQAVTRYWYGGPDAERHESEVSVFASDGSVASEHRWTTVRADGTVWMYRPFEHLVQVNEDDGGWGLLSAVLAGNNETPDAAATEGLEGIVDGLAACFDAE